MPLTLYGSTTSPYVRRVRMAMHELEHDFSIVNIYDDDIREQFSRITPIRKLPVLVHDEQTIFDSHAIYEYLVKHFQLPALSFDEYNLLTVTDAVLDSLILVFLGQRSDLPVDGSKLLFKLQMQRVPKTLEWLNEQADAFNNWHMPTMSLVSLMDWAEFRELQAFDSYPDLLKAREQHKDRPAVIATVPHV